MSRSSPPLTDAVKKGPFGCKCQTLAHKLVGDGCDECQPMSDGIDHEGYTVAAVEEAQLVTDLRAENARLREALVKIRRRTGELAIPKVIAAETMLGLWKIADDALEWSDE